MPVKSGARTGHPRWMASSKLIWGTQSRTKTPEIEQPSNFASKLQPPKPLDIAYLQPYRTWARVLYQLSSASRFYWRPPQNAPDGKLAVLASRAQALRSKNIRSWPPTDPRRHVDMAQDCTASTEEMRRPRCCQRHLGACRLKNAWKALPSSFCAHTALHVTC